MRVVPPEPCLDNTASSSNSTPKLDSLKLWDFRIQEGIVHNEHYPTVCRHLSLY